MCHLISEVIGISPSNLDSSLCFIQPGIRYIYIVVVWGQVGKEFADNRQNEREIKFITVGYSIRTTGQLKAEPMLNRVLNPFLCPGYKEWDRGLVGHLLIG